MTIPSTDAGPAGRLASTAARARGGEEGGGEEVIFGFLDIWRRGNISIFEMEKCGIVKYILGAEKR